MDIAKKIEEIRQEPDHIRMRWVLGCVIVCMIIIAAVWFFSISAMLRNYGPSENTDADFTDIKQGLQEIKNQAPSLKSLQEQQLGAEENTQNQNPYANDDYSDAPQASSYSNLQNSSNNTNSDYTGQ